MKKEKLSLLEEVSIVQIDKKTGKGSKWSERETRSFSKRVCN